MPAVTIYHDTIIPLLALAGLIVAAKIPVVAYGRGFKAVTLFKSYFTIYGLREMRMTFNKRTRLYIRYNNVLNVVLYLLITLLLIASFIRVQAW